MPAPPQAPGVLLVPTIKQNESPEPSPSVEETLAVHENGLCARLINGTDFLQVEAFQRLRYAYFVRQRGWVTEDPRCPGRESDCYDGSSFHLGVFKEENLVAYLRALAWQSGCGFMLEREFRSLLPFETGDCLDRHNAVELTRLVVAPRPELALREVGPSSELLFRLFYRLARRQGWENMYIVVEQDWLPLFSRRFGFSFEPLGCPHTFPDGTRTVAAQARLADLEAGLAKMCPDKLDWYRQP
jgi:N-acyl-L-homoserine lactone synthetase